jgi:nucleoside-diphosphate-sugar epimerase
MAKILIVGCGDLGTGLAHVLSDKGHQVTGLKRHPPSRDDRIRYVAADITTGAGFDALDTDFDQLFFIVTPDGRNESDYRAIYETGLHHVLAKLPRCPWIFVSSTSVYAQSQGEWVDEESPAEPQTITGRLIRQAEQRLTSSNPDNVIVRFSGIYGPLWDVISWLAERMHCAPPVAKAAGMDTVMNKRCSNRRLKALGYQFRYPDFKKGYAELTDKSGPAP